MGVKVGVGDGVGDGVGVGVGVKVGVAVGDGVGVKVGWRMEISFPAFPAGGMKTAIHAVMRKGKSNREANFLTAIYPQMEEIS